MGKSLRDRRSLARLPTALTILPTYTCTAACKDCCFRCSPKVKGRIPQDRILRYISEAKEITSIKLIVFSGGECFLLGKDLDNAVSKAVRLGFRTRCVSNAFWATSQASARARLRGLSDANLNELNISTGDFHQKWVPIGNVLRAAVEGVSLGLSVAIVVEGQRNGAYTLRKLSTEPALVEIMNDDTCKGSLVLLQSPWMPSDLHPATGSMGTDDSVEKRGLPAGGCTSVLSTLVISPSEYLGACCGLTHEQIPEMRLGSLREHGLRELIDSGKRDFLKLWLMIEGPLKILRWAAEKDSRIEWEGKYRHHCDACRAIYSNPLVRSIIRSRYHEKIPDTMFRFTLFDRLGLDSKGDRNDSC